MLDLTFTHIRQMSSDPFVSNGALLQPLPLLFIFFFPILLDGRHFFQFASATMGYQMTTCKVLGIATSCGSKDVAARVYSIPIGACFKSIFIILHLFFMPPLPFSAPPYWICAKLFLWLWLWHCDPIKVTVVKATTKTPGQIRINPSL